MGEIKRVYTAVEAFFDSSGIEKLDELQKILQRTVNKASRRLGETARDRCGEECERIHAIIQDAEKALEDAVENVSNIKEQNIAAFQEVALKALVARRATYPLKNPEASYLPDLDPKDALLDDNDAYAFAIFDTFAEDIQFILPALFGLAMEGDMWEDEAQASDSQ